MNSKKMRRFSLLVIGLGIVLCLCLGCAFSSSASFTSLIASPLYLLLLSFICLLMSNCTAKFKPFPFDDPEYNGDLDAFVINNGRANRIYVNNGMRSFAAANAGAATNNSRDVALGDLDLE